MSKMELKTKTRNREVKTFVGMKSVPLGMHRWGIEPVYKKDIVEEEVVCLCAYNIKAYINNLVMAALSLIQKEVA